MLINQRTTSLYEQFIDSIPTGLPQPINQRTRNFALTENSNIYTNVAR